MVLDNKAKAGMIFSWIKFLRSGTHKVAPVQKRSEVEKSKFFRDLLERSEKCQGQNTEFCILPQLPYPCLLANYCMGLIN